MRHVLSFPYVLLDRAASRIDVQTDAAWVLLAIHVTTASTAMILGALQLVPRIRANRRRQRIIGRTFIGFGTVAFVLTGVPLAILTPDGNLIRYGVLIPALLWPVLTVTGWQAIRRGGRRTPPGVDGAALRRHLLRDHHAAAGAADAARPVPVMQSRYDCDDPLRSVARLDPQPAHRPVRPPTLAQH